MSDPTPATAASASSATPPAPPSVPAAPELATVEITDLAFGGEGVGRLPDGLTVFVPFTAVGDRAEIAVTQRRAKFARGAVRTLLTPGPGRVKPGCPLFGRCGGCQYQHLSSATQTAAKVRQLAELLRRVGGLTAAPAVDPVLVAGTPYAYRNKLVLHPLPGATPPAAYGFHDRSGAALLAVERCPLALAPINRRLREFRARPPAIPEVLPLTVRVDATGRVEHFVRASFKRAWLTERIAGRTLSVPLAAFYQVNPPVFDAVVAWLKGIFAATPPGPLIDAYCGVGVFALTLAEHFTPILGIEADKDAAHAARVNARALGATAATFEHALTEAALPQALAAPVFTAAPGTVLLDPPRGGCEPKVISTLAKHGPPTVVYVSCDPATLARDLRGLCRDGVYAVRRVALAEMFPQTAHFESIVILERAGSAGYRGGG